jgi:streptomycin 6-kinase
LPEAARVAAEYAARHGLTLGEPFPSQVGYAVPAGPGAVVKVNPPWEIDSALEAEALEHFAGRGAVRLLQREDHTLLLERCEPGTSLWELPEDEANPLAAGVLAELWRPAAAGHPFRRLADVSAAWVDELAPRAADPIVAAAVALARDLAPTQGEQVVLHQDLHQGNILLSARGWLAIDPKPLVGEREFDVASLIRDRRFAFDPALPARRLDFYVRELGLDRERARGWAIVHAVAWGIGHEAMLASARSLL